MCFEYIFVKTLFWHCRLTSFDNGICLAYNLPDKGSLYYQKYLAKSALLSITQKKYFSIQEIMSSPISYFRILWQLKVAMRLSSEWTKMPPLLVFFKNSPDVLLTQDSASEVMQSLTVGWGLDKGRTLAKIVITLYYI